MADDVQSFEFKPALLQGRNNWTLDGGFLTRNGELFCSLDDITGARFAQMSVRHTHSAWFDLQFEGGRHRIACNMPPGDENYRQFMSLCAAVLNDLDTRKSGIRVSFGAGGAVRWSMFLTGLVAALFGLGILISLANGGVRESRTLAAFIFGAGFALFGAGMSWSYRPWAPPAILAAGTARDLVARLALHGHPQTGKDQDEEPEDGKG